MISNHDKTDKSTFISYRNSDGANLPFNLRNYLTTKKVDVFFDQEEHVNSLPIESYVITEAAKRHNFVILFSEKSIHRLIKYFHGDQSVRDYVHIELNTAIQHHNNIIAVFFEDKIAEGTVDDLVKQLFVDCWGLEDSYSYIHRKPGENDADLFERIFKRLDAKQFIPHIDLSGIYWVGTRRSDMPDIGYGCGFKGSISLFGKHSEENHIIMCEESSEKRVDHNDSADIDQDIFLEESIALIIDRDPEARFMFYNPSTIYRLNLIEKYGAYHFICLNDKEILECVNNKRHFRELAKDIVPLLPITERTRTDCDYEDLLEAKKRGDFTDINDYQVSVPEMQYDEDVQFIIQAPVSSGGSGTFILNRRNAQFLLSSLDKRAKYLVSVYHKRNISVNMHVIIYKNKIIYCPASIQIIREVSTENKLLYKGADFIAYEQIGTELREQFEAQVKKVAEKLRLMGYRGVCGIDAIIHNGRVNILEVNGRFQASTELLNLALLRRGYKTLQELNYEAFLDTEIADVEPFHFNFKVPYSNYTFSYDGQTMHNAWIYKRASKAKLVEHIQADGYIPDPHRRYNAQAYLYRIAFHKNIASVNEDGAVTVNENICEPEKWLTRKILAKEKLAVKIALLIQGINIEQSIQHTLREATNNAVDLQIGAGRNMMIINSPTAVRFVEFSPFSLVPSAVYGGRYRIFYYEDLLLDNVGVFPEDPNQDLQLKDKKHTYSEIAYLSTDRLRIHLTNACCFKQEDAQNGCANNGCKFCNIEVNPNPHPITVSDIEEVVEKYVSDKRKAKKNGDAANGTVLLRHFLIGGQSLQNGEQQLIDTARKLSKYRMPVYVMSLPLKEETVRELVSCGVLEYAYNIEIFNEECRKKYMPGKGRIPAENYIAALKKTRHILNRANYAPERKAVRSMIIVGLEPYKDMLSGIRTLIDHNIEPMLSVFRPLPDTPLENLNAPPIKMVYELFNLVSNMLYDSKPNKLSDFPKLGPKCTCCQNNTVSLPWNIQVRKEVKTVWCIEQSKERFEG